MDNLDSSSKWHRSRNMVLQALSRSLLQCSIPPIVHYLITIIENIQLLSYVLSVGSQFQWKQAYLIHYGTKRHYAATKFFDASGWIAHFPDALFAFLLTGIYTLYSALFILTLTWFLLFIDLANSHISPFRMYLRRNAYRLALLFKTVLQLPILYTFLKAINTTTIQLILSVVGLLLYFPLTILLSYLYLNPSPFIQDASACIHPWHQVVKCAIRWILVPIMVWSTQDNYKTALFIVMLLLLAYAVFTLQEHQPYDRWYTILQNNLVVSCFWISVCTVVHVFYPQENEGAVVMLLAMIFLAVSFQFWRKWWFLRKSDKMTLALRFIVDSRQTESILLSHHATCQNVMCCCRQLL